MRITFETLELDTQVSFSVEGKDFTDAVHALIGWFNEHGFQIDDRLLEALASAYRMEFDGYKDDENRLYKELDAGVAECVVLDWDFSTPEDGFKLTFEGVQAP